MGAARQNLAELPGVEGDVRPVDAVDRCFHDHRRGAMTGVGRPAVDEPAHVGFEARHVEGTVLHADIDIVGPGLCVLLALLVGQDVAGVRAVVVERLVGLQEFDGAIDALRRPLGHCGSSVIWRSIADNIGRKA